MNIKKTFSTLLVLVNLFLLFSIVGHCESTQSHTTDYSDRLKSFITNNSTYATFEYVNGEKIISTNRLVVSTNSNEPIENDMGAVDKLEGSYNWHFFQYSCKEDLVKAYQFFEMQDYVNYVETDETVDVYEPTETYSYKTKNTVWYEGTLKLSKANSVLKNSNIKLHETLVAVVDSGLDTSHIFFDEDENKAKLILGKDEIDNIPYPTTTPKLYVHGTKVGGAIFNNTLQNVKIRPYNCCNVLFDD